MSHAAARIARKLSYTDTGTSLNLIAGGIAPLYLGLFSAGNLPGPVCVKHSSRFSTSAGQPIIGTADLVAEGWSTTDTAQWCWRCACKGPFVGHEYVLQHRRGPLYEVLDITLQDGECTEPVFIGSLDAAIAWRDAEPKPQPGLEALVIK